MKTIVTDNYVLVETDQQRWMLYDNRLYVLVPEEQRDPDSCMGCAFFNNENCWSPQTITCAAEMSIWKPCMVT